MNNIDFRFELWRKIFHISSFIFPLFYLFISKPYMVLILLLIMACTLYIDISRHHDTNIQNYVTGIFGKLMRKSEKEGSFQLTGASFMIVGFFITGLLFSKGLAITSWFILIISDSVAALVGIKIGKKTDTGKSLEGSVAFLGTSIFISMLCYFFIGYSTSFLIIIISCILTTSVEYYAKKINIDDNLSIPFTYAFSTSILHFLA